MSESPSRTTLLHRIEVKLRAGEKFTGGETRKRYSCHHVSIERVCSGNTKKRTGQMEIEEQPSRMGTDRKLMRPGVL